MLRRVAPMLHPEALKLIFTAIIRPHLEYCSLVLDGASDTCLRKLDVVQKKAARIIVNAPFDAHAAPLLEQLGLQSLQQRRCNRMHKVSNEILLGNCHPAISKLFCITHHLSPTQGSNRTSAGKKRFSVLSS